MANKIAYAKNYTAILDEVYQREACSTVLNSPKRLASRGQERPRDHGAEGERDRTR